jgi:signal transduction histidine kinase
MWIYFAGFVLCCGLLVARSPWFGFFCWIGYTHAFRYLTGVLRYLGLVLIAAVSALAQLGGFRTPTAIGVTIWLVVTLLNATLVTTFIYLGEKAENQNQARKQMVTDLAEANQRLEEMMAENTGLHAQLLTQAREAGVLEERQRMAREIHDTLAQGLTGIITQLEAVQQAGPGPGWERRISNAARLARHSLTEARRSVRAVRPESLENTRLPEAVADVAAQWSADNGVRADVATTGTVLGIPRSRLRCCGWPRKPWPTWPSTPARPGSASPCRTWRTWCRWTSATTAWGSNRKNAGPPTARAGSG